MLREKITHKLIMKNLSDAIQFSGLQKKVEENVFQHLQEIYS